MRWKIHEPRICILLWMWYWERMQLLIKVVWIDWSCLGSCCLPCSYLLKQRAAAQIWSCLLKTLRGLFCQNPKEHLVLHAAQTRQKTLWCIDDSLEEVYITTYYRHMSLAISRNLGPTSTKGDNMAYIHLQEECFAVLTLLYKQNGAVSWYLFRTYCPPDTHAITYSMVIHCQDTMLDLMWPWADINRNCNIFLLRISLNETIMWQITKWIKCVGKQSIAWHTNSF